MTIIVVSGNAAGFAQDIEVGQHRLAADEPEAVGGTDTGPSPTTCCCPRSVPAPRDPHDVCPAEAVAARARER